MINGLHGPGHRTGRRRIPGGSPNELKSKPLKPKNLLTQLSDLEASLNNFSFEELSSEEATRLQRSFLTFKSQLEEKVWGEEGTVKPEDPGVEENVPSAEEIKGGDLGRVASVCRQMKNPLNAIIGLTDLLSDSGISGEQQYHVHSIQLAGRELTNAVMELYEYSRLFAGLEQFEKVPFNFHNLIQDVEYLCNTLIVNKRMAFRVEVDQAIPRKISGDPSKLSQVLLHLLGNSLKQESEGSITLEVQFLHQEEENIFLEFVISCQGGAKGREEANQENSLRPSIQAAFRRTGDTGLGLPIVKQIIEKLGGELFIQDTSGQPASYAFRLPFTRGQNHGEPLKGSHHSSDLKGMHVLVIEKNPLNQKMLERRLVSWGCHPYVTENPDHGLRLLDETVDLVLMDFQSPGLDAFSVTAKIRSLANPSLKMVPVIALVNQMTADDRDKLIRLGVDAIIIKPYGAAELHTKLRQYKKAAGAGSEKLPSSMNHISAFPADGRKINLLPVLEDCLGKMETLEELVILYKQKALEFIGAVKLLLDRSDFKGIDYACQKVSGSLKLLKTDSLTSLVEQIHKTSRTSQDIRHLRFLHRCFIEEYPLVEAALDSELAKLRNNH